MKILSALMLQLVSCAALAGNTSASLLVTVTVVRPAPVTAVISVETQPIKEPGQLQPAMTGTPRDGIQYVVINY